MLEEPFSAAGVLPPPNQLRVAAFVSGEPCAIGFERAGTSQLQTVGQEWGSRVQVRSDVEARHITSDELVVKKTLEVTLFFPQRTQGPGQPAEAERGCREGDGLPGAS